MVEQVSAHCERCGAQFEPKPQKRFCSRTCKKATSRAKPGRVRLGPVTGAGACRNCGDPFSTVGHGQVFCGAQCADRGHRTCSDCGVPVSRHAKRCTACVRLVHSLDAASLRTSRRRMRTNLLTNLGRFREPPARRGARADFWSGVRRDGECVIADRGQKNAWRYVRTLAGVPPGSPTCGNRRCILAGHRLTGPRRREVAPSGKGNSISSESYEYRAAMWTRRAIGRARGRATANGLPFGITAGDIVLPKLCPVLGIALVLGDRYSSDNSPSLDRIDPARGYVRGNVAVISQRANRLKQDASPAELLAIVAYARGTLTGS
jgi:hypothetical protein